MNYRLLTFGFLLAFGIGVAAVASAANPQALLKEDPEPLPDTLAAGAVANPQIILQQISTKIKPDVKAAFEKICDDLLKPEMLDEAKFSETALRAALLKAFPKGIPGMNHEAGLIYLSHGLKAKIQSRLIILQKPGSAAEQKSGMIGDTGKPAIIGDSGKKAIVQGAPGQPPGADEKSGIIIIGGKNVAPGASGPPQAGSEKSGIVVIGRKIIGNLDALAANAAAKAQLK